MLPAGRGAHPRFGRVVTVSCRVNGPADESSGARQAAPVRKRSETRLRYTRLAYAEPSGRRIDTSTLNLLTQHRYPPPLPMMPSSRKLTGLYALTPEMSDTDQLCRLVEQALLGGAMAIQYRQKLQSPAQAERQGRALQALCARFERPLIVNDSVELALAIDAQGVHLGRDDEAPALARRRLGPDRLIGVSCYDRFDLAEAAAGIADHVAFGSVFASPTKPAAVRAPLDLFRRAKAAGMNTVAIGGIEAGNAAQVVAAGADAIAVISGVFGAPDPRAAAAELEALFGT